MNVLLASSEVSPFAKTGGLGDVAEALPIALNEAGHKASAILPFYKLVREHGYSPKPVKAGIPLKIGGKDLIFDLLCLEYKKTNFYFIKNDSLFDRDGLYGTPAGDHPDNHLRFGLFSRAIIASIPYIGKPDILHLNDWHTGLVPLYLKYNFKKDPNLKGAKTLFSIHNLAYQGLFPKSLLSQLDIPEECFTASGLEFYDKISFIKSGIVYSDAINTVSEGYAAEVLKKEFGCGLDKILRTREKDLYGIVNGADYSTWNPETDKNIAKNYGPGNLKPKLECKKDLLKEFGIPFNEEAPLVGMITRLAQQKGLDIVANAMDDILEMGVNFVILGTGDERYNKLFKDLAGRYKGRAGAAVTFNNPLAHKIEAGCDMFLMPSRYEPCGLNQMYSMKYATVPVVRDTGGLKDTVTDFNAKSRKGNGFKFKDATQKSMLGALERAVKTFKDRATWKALQDNCLGCDFSWESTAKHYIQLYKRIKEK
ncbi:MAG: glycogen synthase GlgA [Candidatus Omnitrophica bacterium]|nr:glycogen synthase GlgA [Candidatus Omnitrophota bacterium]